MEGSPSLLMTNSVYPSLLMNCPMSILELSIFPWQRNRQGVLCRHVYCTQNRRLGVFRHRFCHVVGSCIFTEETEVDLDLSRFSHCRTAKMRRISTLAQATREAPRHWRNVRNFMSLNFHRILRFAWSIQNLGLMGSCTLNELILTSFNPLPFTKLLFRPGLVFTKPLPQLIFRAVNGPLRALSRSRRAATGDQADNTGLRGTSSGTASIGTGRAGGSNARLPSSRPDGEGVALLRRSRRHHLPGCLTVECQRNLTPSFV